MADRIVSPAVFAACVLSGPALALEVDPLVPPEINIGGRALATVNAGDGESRLDISDSSLLLGFSKYLFNDRRYGFGVVGFKRPADSPDLEGEVYFHQLHAGIGGRAFEVKLGRSRLRNSLVAFPTVREDDLLEFTHAGNVLSHAENEIHQLYGNVAELSVFPARSVSVLVGLSARTEADVSGETRSRDRFNGASVGLAYELPEAIKFDRGVRYAGIMFDSQRVREANDERVDVVLAGFTLNLNTNPEGNWVWDLQALHNGGLEGAGALTDEVDRARARSVGVATAVRYISRPYLQTRWQGAVTVGWKDYRDADNASAVAVAPTLLYRLGSQVDWLAQYIYTRNDDVLAAAVGREDSHRVFLGLSFGLDYTLNESVGERQSILSLEHGMGTIGPIGGGH